MLKEKYFGNMSWPTINTFNNAMPYTLINFYINSIDTSISLCYVVMYGLSTVSFMSVVAYLLHVFIVYMSLCFYECLFLICKVFPKHNGYVHMQIGRAHV